MKKIMLLAVLCGVHSAKSMLDLTTYIEQGKDLVLAASRGDAPAVAQLLRKGESVLAKMCYRFAECYDPVAEDAAKQNNYYMLSRLLKTCDHPDFDVFRKNPGFFFQLATLRELSIWPRVLAWSMILHKEDIFKCAIYRVNQGDQFTARLYALLLGERTMADQLCRK